MNRISSKELVNNKVYSGMMPSSRIPTAVQPRMHGMSSLRTLNARMHDDGPRWVLQAQREAWNRGRCRNWIEEFDEDPVKPSVFVSRAMSLLATVCVVLGSSLQVPCSWAGDQERLPAIVDYAKVLPSGTIDGQIKKLEQLEKDTGYKVRVLSRYTDSQGNRPTVEDLRSGWGIREDVGTYVVVFVDPSAPNVLSFKYGKKVQEVLSRPFFTELQSRYGNMFYVRDEGEEKSISSTLDALDICLRREDGCAVPPGLPQEQYVFTLICCVIGGFILGASLRLQPQGFVKRQWVYAVLFGPLWLTLSLSYGIGPVISRTDDPLPVIANVAATFLSALLIKKYPEAANTVGLTMSSTMDDEDDDKI